MNKLKFLAILCGFALVTGIRHFFISSVRSVTLRFYSVNPPGFEYSATNINRRDAEFPRDVETYLITST